MDLTELGFGGKNSRAVGSGLFIAKLVIQLLAHKLLPFVVPWGGCLLALVAGVGAAYRSEPVL